MSQKKPTYTETAEDLGPGMVSIVGQVVKKIENDTICGRHYDASIVFAVHKIVGLGRGLTKRIAEGQRLKVGLRKVLISKMTIGPQEGSQMQLMMKESLCQPPDEVNYLLISLTPQDSR